MDRFTQYAVVAAREAVKDSQLDIKANANRIGVWIGSGIGGMETFETAHTIGRTWTKTCQPILCTNVNS